MLSIVVRRAFRIRELEDENGRLREQTGSMALEGIIGVSDAMRSLCRAIEKVAPTNATVLVLGDSGTGKELMARALHRLSRPLAPAVRRDQLRGDSRHAARERAVRLREGRLHRRRASARSASSSSPNGGTVFLDEIGEMPASLQAKLLRVLQERVVERVGGRTPIPLDLRIHLRHEPQSRCS